jgi:LPXTG-motif cell wall-anchored protein
MKKHLFIILVILITLPYSVLGATGNMVLDLTVDPQKVLFDVRNLKPGDSISRKITVFNNGENGFQYLVSNKFKNGSIKFFEQLTLRIEDNSKVIYEGNLHEFEKLAPRILNSKSNEDLYFLVTVPYDLDNTFQGLNCIFELKFYAEGTLGGVLPADGLKLPNTGSDMFNILVVGAVLVLTGSTFKYILKRRVKIGKEL